MEKNSPQKEVRKPESDLHETDKKWQSEELKTPTNQEQEKAISNLRGLEQRIEECPSERVKEILRDSLNKENSTSEKNG